MYRALSSGTSMYVLEERADRNKGIRDAEDGQSGSGASSSYESNYREKEEEEKENKECEWKGKE